MPFVGVNKPWVTEFFNIRTKIRCGGRETKDPHDLDVSLVNLTLILMLVSKIVMTVMVFWCIKARHWEHPKMYPPKLMRMRMMITLPPRREGSMCFQLDRPQASVATRTPRTWRDLKIIGNFKSCAPNHTHTWQEQLFFYRSGNWTLAALVPLCSHLLNSSCIT